MAQLEVKNEKLTRLSIWAKNRFTHPPCPRTLQGWCEKGYIPAKKIGELWFVKVEQEYLETGDDRADSILGEMAGIQ
jgi:hypothetical protein